MNQNGCRFRERNEKILSKNALLCPHVSPRIWLCRSSTLAAKVLFGSWEKLCFCWFDWTLPAKDCFSLQYGQLCRQWKKQKVLALAKVKNKLCMWMYKRLCVACAWARESVARAPPRWKCRVRKKTGNSLTSRTRKWPSWLRIMKVNFSHFSMKETCYQDRYEKCFFYLYFFKNVCHSPPVRVAFFEPTLTWNMHCK